MRPYCLVVDKMHPSIIPLLEEIGFKVDYQPLLDRQGILDAIPQAVGLIIRNKTRVDREVLDQALKLRFIGRAGAGMDLIDTDECTARGIHTLNAPEGNRTALAEHALGMLLALLNKITIANQQVKGGIWDRESNRGTNLTGKTVGIMGYGFMGSAFAQLLSSFDCTVLAYDKYKKGPFEYASEVTLPDLFSSCDILSLHVPLTPETTNMVDQSFFRKFKNDIYLVNTSRGGVVNETDLVTELESGKIKGAAMDVIENERIGNLNRQQAENLSSLSAFDQVIITPHVGGWSHESFQKINQVLAGKIKSLDI